MRRVVNVPTYRTIVALDPDSTRTALARADLDGASPGTAYKLRELRGGGAGKPVAWGAVDGALDYLRQLEQEGREPEDVLVIVETQPPDSPWSRSVEDLRRVRYHWDAACVLMGIRCEHVPPAAWEAEVVPEGRGAGSVKRGAKVAAEEMLGRKVNQDKADALLLLRWMVRQLGSELIVS